MPYQRIRDLREDADLTQKQIAELLNMHKTTYVRYESGEREIPLKIAIALANYYGVTLDYLAGLSDQPQNLDSPANRRYNRNTR